LSVTVVTRILTNKQKEQEFPPPPPPPDFTEREK
jgi:hypothetical protein